MGIVRAILSHWLARQVAQHGSVGALAIGLGAHLLGIPLAGEQISALLYAFSVVCYVLTQLKSLRNPAPTPPTITLPPSAHLAIVLAAALAIGGELRARAEVYTLTWNLPTQAIDNTPLPAGSIAATRIQCGPGSVSPVPWAIDVSVTAPASSYDADFATVGPWNCHVWIVLTNGKQSDDTPDLQFTVPLPLPPPATPNPKPATNLRVARKGT